MHAAFGVEVSVASGLRVAEKAAVRVNHLDVAGVCGVQARLCWHALEERPGGVQTCRQVTASALIKVRILNLEDLQLRPERAQ